jgi:hypothetical protein
MRILNAAQMREDQHFNIEKMAIPSWVLKQNDVREVVSAIETTNESLLDGRVAV